MQQYLVRRKDNAVFVWTETLAKRKDLEEVFAENAQDALKKDRIPDPRRLTLDELENMTKTDLMLFASLKLSLDLTADMTKGDMLDEVKGRLFAMPSKHAEDDAKASVRPAALETRPMSTAAQAKRQAGA